MSWTCKRLVNNEIKQGAKTISEHLGLPVNAVWLKSDYKDFVHEFTEEKYLSYFFNTYQQLMLEHVHSSWHAHDSVRKSLYMFWIIFGSFISLLLFMMMTANPGNTLIKNKKTKEHLLDILTAFMGGFLFVFLVWLFYSGAKDEGLLRLGGDIFRERQWSSGRNTGYFIIGFIFTYIIIFIRRQYKKL